LFANLANIVADQRRRLPPPAADALPSAPPDAMLAPHRRLPAPPAAAAELSGMSLLWRACLSWLRDLAGKREKPR